LHSATSYAPDDPQYPATREQAELIHAYAGKNNIDVVKTYIDAGKCGSNARSGLRSMISDVHSGTAEYSVILMRDISRWGRERMDEAAHYEFICRRAGFAVHYIDESFKNDGGIMSSIIKTVKRAMEGEYRRERAAKAKAARLRRKAHKAGVPAETELAHE
jgi:DNA invertase Pin-like site-specific DNA recombinase